MNYAIVLDEHTLGVPKPNNTLQILRASILKGSPLLGDPNVGVIAFDPILQAGRWRRATEQDFEDFGVMFNSQYLGDPVGTP